MKAGWEEKTLGEVTEIINGGTPKSKVDEFWNGDVNWLTPKDMGKLVGKYVVETPRKITKLGLQKSSAKLARPRSVIMSTRAPIGHLAINKVPMAFNQGCRALQSTERVDEHFLYYFLSANVKALNDLGTGTTFRELSAKALKEFSIPLPPIAEQKQIVSVLDQAFAGIERAVQAARKNRDNARELFETTLHATFTQKGEDWVERKFEDCIEKVDTPEKVQRKQFLLQGRFPIVSQEKDFVNGYWDSPREVFSLSKPVVVFGDHTRILKYVDFDFVIGADGVKVLQPASYLSPRFFYFALLANPVKSLGYARHFRLLKQKKISFPMAIEEQNRVVDKLERVIAQTQCLEALYQQKLDALDELKQSLLQKAFAGELTAGFKADEAVADLVS